MEFKKLNRQAQWSLYLSHFDFVLIHKLGPTMEKADALSRHVDHKEVIYLLKTKKIFYYLKFES